MSLELIVYVSARENGVTTLIEQTLVREVFMKTKDEVVTEVTDQIGDALQTYLAERFGEDLDD